MESCMRGCIIRYFPLARRSAGGKHLEEYQKTLTGIDGSRASPKPAKIEVKKTKKGRERHEIEFDNPVNSDALAGIQESATSDAYASEKDNGELAEDEVETLEGEEWAACVKSFFPLHDDDELEDLALIWARLGLVFVYPMRAVLYGVTLRPWGILIELKKLTEQPLQVHITA